MITTLWSAKGGAGVSVVAAARALALGRSGTSTLAVDLCGDLPAVFGLPVPSGPGLADWLASDGPADALGRLCVEVTGRVDLLHRGGGPLGTARAGELCELLASMDGEVVVDAGRLSASGSTGVAAQGESGLVEHLLASGRSLLVTRACFLALRRATLAGVPRADGVVLVEEPGRSLDHRDVADVLGLPVVARVGWDPVVARAVDAGVVTGRLPAALRSARLDAA